MWSNQVIKLEKKLVARQQETVTLLLPRWKEIIRKLNVVYFSAAGRCEQRFSKQTLKNMSFVFHFEPIQRNLTTPPKYGVQREEAWGGG